MPCVTNDAGRVVKLYDLYGRGSPYTELVRDPRILDPMESLLGPNIVLTRYRHNLGTVNAPGDNPTRLHRDVLQWSRTIVTALLYLDESTVDNGSTLLIPGSHFLPYVGTPNNGGTWMDEHHVFAQWMEKAIPVPMPVGSMLFFDSTVFHTVGKNNTDGLRASVIFGYHSVDELEEELPPSKILVRGENLYRGNDLRFRSK